MAITNHVLKILQINKTQGWCELKKNRQNDATEKNKMNFKANLP